MTIGANSLHLFASAFANLAAADAAAVAAGGILEIDIDFMLASDTTLDAQAPNTSAFPVSSFF